MKTEQSLITGENASGISMTRSCAADLTKQINSASEDLAGMLKRAHDEKAWQALGYDDWKSYVAAELKFSEQRSFQLLDFATIRGELADSTMVESEVLPTSERVTRELKKAPPAERAEKYAKAVVISGGKEPTAKTVKAVVEQQEQPIKQAEAKETEGEVVEEMSDAEWAAMKETNPAFIKAREVLAVLDQFPIENDWSIDALHDIEIRIREISKACWDFNSASAKAAKEARK